jgi:hypothetical protein
MEVLAKKKGSHQFISERGVASSRVASSRGSRRGAGSLAMPARLLA